MQNKLHFYTVAMSYPKKKLRKKLIYNSIKKNKTLRNKLNKAYAMETTTSERG